MINPSTIDLKSLPWLPLEEKTAFPSRPAIYFAIDSLGDVQYIGRTKNVRTRWNQHHKYRALSAIADIKVAYLFIDAPELLPDIEQALIEYFNPPLNARLKKRIAKLKVKASSRHVNGSRRSCTYRLDERLGVTLAQVAKEKGISVNNLVENIILENLKARGKIDKDFIPLGEMRGGDRRSKEVKQ